VITPKLYRHAAVSAALLLATSCSDGAPPTGPSAPVSLAAAAASARGHHRAHGDVIKREGRLRDDVSRRATIGPEGGVLVIPEAGLVLVVPAGALFEATTITATALKGKRVVYDFQPHGLQFAAPVMVGQTLGNTELNRRGQRPIDVWGAYLANGAADVFADGSADFAEIFKAIYSGDEDDALLVFSTTHFSGYAMASGIHSPRPADNE
jgi:hypothetical protein